MKIMIRKELYDEFMCDKAQRETEIEKGFHKYISKIVNGNKTRYIYEQNEKQAVKKIVPCTSALLDCDISNAKVEGEKFLKQWAKEWNPGKKCETLNSTKVMLDVSYKPSLKRYGISIFHLTHKGKQFGEKLRSPKDIFERARLLPVAKEILTDKRKGTVVEVRTSKNKVEYAVCGKVAINGKIQVVCVIVTKIKPNIKTYVSTINKAMSDYADIAVISNVYLVNPEVLTNRARLNLGLSGLSGRPDKAVEKSTKGMLGELQDSISDRNSKHTSNIPQTSETVKEYVEKSIQILRECGAV